jgi:hypothetical protein
VVSDQPPSFKDQFQGAQVLDVLQRVALDDDQVCQLADFDGTQLMPDAAHLGSISGRRQQGLPGCSAILHP